MVSAGISLLFLIAKSIIQLSLPPEAYRCLSSWLNCKPYHSLPITFSSISFSFTGSISWIDCVLWPLLETASILPEFDSWIFRGRSPKGNEVPAGLNFHPFGSSTWLVCSILPGSCACADNAVANTAAKPNNRLRFMVCLGD